MLTSELSPANAAFIAPAKIVPCAGSTDEQVREMLAQGINAARRMQNGWGRLPRS
jgi:hypothetical protein